MTHWFNTLNRRNKDSIKLDMALDLSGREDVIALSVADSDYETAPEIKKALLERIHHGAFGYLGTPKDYDKIIQSWFLRRYHVALETSWVIPVPKVLNAISSVMQSLTNTEDKVLIQPPVYHVFKPAIVYNRRTLVKNELMPTKHGYKIDFEDLDCKLASGVKLFLLCSPHNPVGRVFTQEELSKIVLLCKKHNVILVSDEIHADLIMPKHEFISAGTFFDCYDKIIIISAPSKSFNLAGLQIAHLITPNNVMLNALKNHYKTCYLSSPNVLAFTAIKAAYTKCDGWIDAQNTHIYANYLKLKSLIESRFEKAWVAPLEGTYLAWIDIGFTQKTSEVFVKELACEGLVLSAGQAFGNHSESFVRMNLACSSEQLSLALERLEKYLSKSVQPKNLK